MLLKVGDEGTLALFRNDGRAGFEHKGFEVPRAGRCFTDWGDFDNDGDLDLLLAARSDSGNLTPRVFRNDGNLGFADLHPGAVPLALTPVLWADLDSDGALDIVSVGVGLDIPERPLFPVSHIFRQASPGRFVDALPWLPGRAARGSSRRLRQRRGPGSRDDGRGLLLFSAPNTIVYGNLSEAPNSRPEAPTTLTATVFGARSGSNGTRRDANQTGGSAYNLRVGATRQR